MLRSTLIALSLGVTSLVFTPSAHAEGTTIAVVDNDILDTAKVVKVIRDQIDAKREEFRKELEKKEKDLSKEEQALAKQRDLISKEAFQQKAKDFQSKMAELRSLFQMRQIQIQQASTKVGQTVREKIYSIVADMAKEKGFNLALSKDRTLYSEPAMDISKEVLARLDAEMPSVKLEIENVKMPAKKAK